MINPFITTGYADPKYLGNYIRVDYSYTLRLFPLKFDRILLSVPVSRNTRQALRAWFPCTGDDDS